MINITLFLSIGFVGIIITMIIYLTGRNKKYETILETEFGYFKILKISFSIILLVYLFRVIGMFFTGIISGLYIPIVIGVIFALVPLILICLTRLKSEKSRV